MKISRSILKENTLSDSATYIILKHYITFYSMTHLMFEGNNENIEIVLNFYARINKIQFDITCWGTIVHT